MLQKAAQDNKFNATLKPRLDVAEANWLAAQPPEETPIYTEQPINDELQTGDSRDLGGEMRIQSPWFDR